MSTTLEAWECPYFLIAEDYQPNGGSLQFGGGWEFTSAPDRPHQRVFSLTLRTMKYFMAGGALDLNAQPALNLGRLKKFYERHGTHRHFWFDHPADGRVKVRFKEPLKVPAGLPDGNGWHDSFEVRLLEMKQ